MNKLPKTTFMYCLLMMLAVISYSCKEEDSTANFHSEALSVNILYPTPTKVFVTTDSTITLRGCSAGINPVKEITYTTDTGQEGTADGIDEWEIRNIELEEGDNNIVVKAIDTQGSSSTASITVTRNRYLLFLDKPSTSDDVFFTGEDNLVWITVGIVPNGNLDKSSVRLVEIDEQSAVIGEICPLYDYGDLENGDEILGDNVYSAIFSISSDTECVRRFRVHASTDVDGEVHKDFSSVIEMRFINKENALSQVYDLFDRVEMVEDEIKEMMQDGDSLSISSLIKTIRRIEGIQSVTEEGNMLKLSHKSGLVSYVMIPTENVKGAVIPDIDGGRPQTIAVPLEQQTRGSFLPSRSPAIKTRANIPETDPDIIKNKNVLIWAPFENSFPQDMYTTLSVIFNSSPVDLKLDYLSNDKCTTASLKDISDYGIIVFDTHGGNGEILLTREKAGKFASLIGDDNYNRYVHGLIDESYYLITMEYYREDLGRKITETFYAVTPKFFTSKLKKSLPGSVVFNGSCESMKTLGLSNAFIAAGAKTYLGFSETVMTNTCINKADEFFTALVGEDLKKTGQAYISDINFTEVDGDETWLNSYLMTGSSDMHFYMGLVNGDFEYGNLNGWNTSGDGRIVTSLGGIVPPQGLFMGIVSTGLGFTVGYGSISQTFRVSSETRLSIKWNFLSEEFMEYVGSQYQDYLRITINDGQTKQVLFNLTIDKFASNYNLKKAQGISFDQGDVYTTGWQNSVFDISSYRNKSVTLTIETGDIGDSFYDSATLLDEIKIY